MERSGKVLAAGMIVMSAFLSAKISFSEYVMGERSPLIGFIATLTYLLVWFVATFFLRNCSLWLTISLFIRTCAVIGILPAIFFPKYAAPSVFSMLTLVFYHGLTYLRSYLRSEMLRSVLLYSTIIFQEAICVYFFVKKKAWRDFE